MKKILVPIDFSENSDVAIIAAKAIVSASGGELVFLHVHEPFLISAPVVTYPSAYLDFEDRSRQRLRSYVDQSQNEGYRADGIFAVGVIETEFEKWTSEISPDLIVIGRTGTGGLIDRILGSTAARVALHSPCPVLVIPAQSTNVKFSRVVYATQLEYQETEILHQVKDLIQILGAQLFFVKINALEQPNRQPDEIFIEQIKRSLGPESEIAVENTGGVAQGIVAYCQKVSADLLIVSARERSFLEGLFVYPRITKELLVDVSIPLLVFRIRS